MTIAFPSPSLSNPKSDIETARWVSYRRIIWSLIACAILFILDLDPLHAKEPLVPHKPPLDHSQNIALTTLLGYFAAVSQLIVEKDYIKSEQLLTDLDGIDIPENVKFLIERYSSLMKTLNVEFNQSQTEISKARYFLQDKQFNSTQRSLQLASVSIEHAKATLSKVKNVSNLLVNFAVLGNVKEPNGFESENTLIPDSAGAIEEATIRLENSFLALEALNQELLDILSSLIKVTASGDPIPQELKISDAPIYEVKLSLDSPSQVLPGQTILIKGQVISVSSEGSPKSANLAIYIGDYLVGEYHGRPEFQYTLTIPARTLEGETKLLVDFPAQGLYQKSSIERDIRIVRYLPVFNTEISQMSWFPPMVMVSGHIESELGAIPQPKILLRYRDHETSIVADRQGNFSIPIETSYLALLLGNEPLMIDIIPSQPWFHNLDGTIEIGSFAKGRFWVIGLGILYLFGLLIIQYIRRKKKSNPSDELSKIHFRTPETLSPYSHMEISRSKSYSFDYQGAQGRIVLIYRNAAQILGSSKGILLLPTTTLRDFLIAVGSQVETAFEELTRLTERALYRIDQPHEEDVTSANQLLEQIREERPDVF